MSIVLILLNFIETMKGQSLWLDNDSSVVETPDNIGFSISSEGFFFSVRRINLIYRAVLRSLKLVAPWVLEPFE